MERLFRGKITKTGDYPRGFRILVERGKVEGQMGDRWTYGSMGELLILVTIERMITCERT